MSKGEATATGRPCALKGRQDSRAAGAVRNADVIVEVTMVEQRQHHADNIFLLHLIRPTSHCAAWLFRSFRLYNTYMSLKLARTTLYT